MRKNILLIIAICFILFSCKKDDNLNDPNLELLLKKEILSSGYYNQYYYNSENKRVKLESYHYDTLWQKIEFRYNAENLLEYIDFPLTNNYLENSDSIKYFLDEKYFVYYTAFLFDKIVSYVNEKNQIIRRDFMEENELLYYTVIEYFKNNKYTSSYYAADGYFAGDITYTCDLMKSSPNIYGLSEPQLGNIINMESDFLNDEGQIFINFNGHANNHGGIGELPPYTSVFEYNIQDYPIKETRTYQGQREPEITYFEYLKAN